MDSCRDQSVQDVEYAILPRSLKRVGTVLDRKVSELQGH
jgi:hypothetical protein